MMKITILLTVLAVLAFCIVPVRVHENNCYYERPGDNQRIFMPDCNPQTKAYGFPLVFRESMASSIAGPRSLTNYAYLAIDIVLYFVSIFIIVFFYEYLRKHYLAPKHNETR